METTETKTANAILQRPQPVTIGDKSYIVSPPSLATLILVSEELSKLPVELLTSEDEENVTIHALRTARHAHGIARAIARLILGAPSPFPSLLERLLSRFRNDPAERLALQLAQRHSPRELAVGFIQLTERLEVGDFFALTAFLSALRVTTPTKEAKAGKTPTAPGR